MGLSGYLVDGKKPQAFGPVSDHTSGEPSGYYFFAYKPMFDRSFETQIVINNLPSTTFRAQCLRFWYQINTPTSSSFYIYVTPSTTTHYSNPLWKVPYTHLDRWSRGQLTINAYYVHKIVFDLFLSKSAPNDTFIALDDISLSSRQCEAPVSCDFDIDICSWNNVRMLQANWNWVKFTGK